MTTYFFKQDPGADIDPGWYYVTKRAPTYADEQVKETLSGPYKTKRDAIRSSLREEL
jgi:hypothetical protein